MGFPDPLKLHLHKEKGGRGFPDPWHLFDSDAPEGMSSAELAALEEARKAALRRKLDIVFGIAPTEATSYEPFAEAPPTGRSDPESGAQTPPSDEEMAAWEQRKAAWESQPGKSFEGEKAAATAAGQQLEGESTKLSEALRAFHSDELGRTYEEGERQNRFVLARRGLLGGSVDVDSNAKLKSERDLGATRVGEAARRGASNLAAQREQERLNATALINSGAGESAVASAQRGLSRSLENASSAAKEKLFTDLFAGTSNAFAANNEAERERALLNRYRQTAAFYPSGGGGSSGRVTSSE